MHLCVRTVYVRCCSLTDIEFPVVHHVFHSLHAIIKLRAFAVYSFIELLLYKSVRRWWRWGNELSDWCTCNFSRHMCVCEYIPWMRALWVWVWNSRMRLFCVPFRPYIIYVKRQVLVTALYFKGVDAWQLPRMSWRVPCVCFFLGEMDSKKIDVCFNFIDYRIEL